MNIPRGWRPRRNQIANSKVPTIKVRPAGNQKRISPALRKYGHGDQEKIPANPRIDARDLPSSLACPWDPRKPHWEDEPIEIARPRSNAIFDMADPTFVEPREPSGVNAVEIINRNWDYLKKEPHFVPYDKPKWESWRVNVPKTPPSSESSTWSQDGIDDQKPKAANARPAPIPRKIIAGRGKPHGCKPSTKIMTKTESEIDQTQFGKPTPEPDFSHLNAVEQAKAKTRRREANAIPKSMRYAHLPINKPAAPQDQRGRSKSAPASRPDQKASERLRVFRKMLLMDQRKKYNRY